MSTTDYSVIAATIVDDIIGLSVGDLGPEDRDPLRVVVRIAFEVQEFLALNKKDAEALEWIQDTIFSGCDSIYLARGKRSFLRRAGALVEPAPEPDTFPSDLRSLALWLDEAIRLMQDDSLPWPERVLAVNRAARLQLVFLGATLL